MEPFVVVHANSIDNTQLLDPHSLYNTPSQDVAARIALKVEEYASQPRIVYLLEDYHSRGYAECPLFNPLLSHSNVIVLGHPGNGQFKGGYMVQGIELKLRLIGMGTELVEMAGYSRQFCVEDLVRLLESRIKAGERKRYRETLYRMELPGIGMRVLLGNRVRVKLLEELCTD